jgi:hypothetical protein
VGGILKYYEGGSGTSCFYQCHEFNLVDSQTSLERIRISRYYNAYGARHKPSEKLQEAGLPAFNGMTSNIYRCSQLNPISLTKVQGLIQDVNSQDAYYIEIDYDLATYPIGALKYYQLSLFTPGSNIIMSGFFASTTLFYYVGSAKSIT